MMSNGYGVRHSGRVQTRLVPERQRRSRTERRGENRTLVPGPEHVEVDSGWSVTVSWMHRTCRTILDQGERMAERGGDDRTRGPRRPGSGPPPRGQRPGPPAGKTPGQKSTGHGRPLRATPIGLKRLGGNDFELTHPKCVDEMELDYAEGIEIWEAGDPEAACDALRYALGGCGDNLWVHVALGKIALEAFNDAELARGHFGYAFELAYRALPRDFRGRLPSASPKNAPIYDAVEGLARCYEAMDLPSEAVPLRKMAASWDRGKSGPEEG